MHNTDQFLIEYVYYVSPDGKEYDLFGGQRALMSWGGLGHAPVNYLTDRGVFQDGETIRDFRFESDRIDLELYENGCNRRDWWCHIGEMIRKIRPNRGSNRSRHGQLYIYPATGEAVKIGAAWADGLAGNWDGIGNLTTSDAREQISFYCADPIFSLIEPIVIESEITADGACLPACLPFCVGSSTINALYNVDYQGTYEGNNWTISLTGPIDFPTITNQTTGKTIELNYQVSPGETVTIKKTPTQTTIANNFGANLIGTVTSRSDLVDFVFVTEGELTPDGNNVIQVTGVNGQSGQSAIIIQYDERHVSAFSRAIKEK